MMGKFGGVQHLRDPPQRVRVRHHAGWRVEQRNVGDRDGVVELRFLPPGVERDVDGALRFGHGHAVPTHEGLGHAQRVVGLVVPLHVVSNEVALNEGGMHPIDPWTASLEAHRAGAAHNDHRGAARVGVVDGHGRVERPHDVVHESDQRAIGYARVAVGDRNGDLLVQALDDLRVVLSRR